MNKKKKINTIVGSIGAFIGVFVFITYIPQIIANLGGEKLNLGSLLQLRFLV